MNNAFKEMLEVGEIGEVAAERLLPQLYPNYKLIDVRQQANWQEKDVDYLLALAADVISLEVKTDRRMGETGNIYVELVSNVGTGRKGWFYYCQAEQIAFYDTENEELHIVSYSDLQQTMKTAYAREITITAYEGNGYTKQRKGALLPIRELAKAPTYNKYSCATYREEIAV